MNIGDGFLLQKLHELYRNKFKICVLELLCVAEGNRELFRHRIHAAPYVADFIM